MRLWFAAIAASVAIAGTASHGQAPTGAAQRPPARQTTLLIDRPEVVGVDLEPGVLTDGTHGSLVVRAKNPRRFFEDFGRLVVSEDLDVARLEPLDESAHAVLGYLLGGSGKT